MTENTLPDGFKATGEASWTIISPNLIEVKSGTVAVVKAGNTAKATGSATIILEVSGTIGIGAHPDAIIRKSVEGTVAAIDGGGVIKIDYAPAERKPTSGGSFRHNPFGSAFDTVMTDLVKRSRF